MRNKRKTLKTLADFFSKIPAWLKREAEPIGKPEPLTPVKPANPPVDPPRPVEYDK